ncbi:MAG: serine hydrolase domain-containing protein [Eubacteriales bacterium]|nr:serine hydrolase domain-containing protein [Eubacteriales bacterium]
MDPITALLQTFVDSGMTAGASAMVCHKGRIVYSGAYGCADLEKQTPFALDSILRIYSMSKVVTSAAIMALQEEGRLRVSDPASKYLRGFAGQKVCVLREGKPMLVPVERDVTIHDLLTMTSGIPYHGEGSADPVMAAVCEGWNGKYAQFRAENQTPNTVGFADFIGSFPLLFQPGERWLYGYSCDVLGGIAEVAAGMPFGEYLRRRFFEPLGMQDTGFSVPKEKQTRVATIYLSEQHRLRAKPEQHDDMDCIPFESGGAGLYSTLPDYMRFARMLLGGGELDGVRCLSAESVAEMAKNHLTDAQRLSYDWDDCPGYGYGYAVRVMTDQSLSCYPEENGSFGWNGAAGTSVRIDPARELVVLFGTQVRPPEHAKYLPQLMKAVAKFLK